MISEEIQKRGKDDLINKYLEKIVIPKRYKEADLKDWNISKSKIESYISNLKDHCKNGYGLVLHGATGTGKTRLTFALVKYIIKNIIQVSVERVKFHILLEDVINLQNGAEYFWKVQNKNILIIDDLGLKKLTDWEQQKLYSLIDYRSEEMLYTIITTNLKENELSNFVGVRSFDRIKENSFFVEFKGKSFRAK